ncbi:hypothetical protein QFC22_006676 [Naganishia vaughanmartiniae]|uniref:Uncharacterized protein n=1 Tax=Naganishia vaughanmartiniae TaxID=1424756 RepID=A0ACC2WI13_9TREE|nr:hypothetical protein QFC22_006676 [Naganishia vaughanmartiniae]
MLNKLPLVLLALLRATPAAAATSYDLIESHKGASFFDGWTFAQGYDNTTNGDVVWANSSKVAYVNGQGKAILKVDNSTEVPYNEKRESIKLYSNNYYRPGTVWVFDASHVPVGCSVWPAVFTQGTNWPEHGEIDIFEVVNNDQMNQYALHTTAGCVASPGSGGQTGTQGFAECDQNQNSGSGCTVRDVDTASAGKGFNDAQGGVYVAAFETDGIRIWFFTRSKIPSALTADATTIDLDSLGTPSARYNAGQGGCDIEKFSGSQRLTLDITLCGDFAGSPTILQQTCPALVTPQTCYTTYVLKPESYADAWFEINYLNVYGTSGSIDPALSVNGGQGGISSSASSSRPTTSSAIGSGTSTARTTSTTTGNAGNALPTQTVSSASRVKYWFGGAGWAVGLAVVVLAS